MYIMPVINLAILVTVLTVTKVKFGEECNFRYFDHYRKKTSEETWTECTR